MTKLFLLPLLFYFFSHFQIEDKSVNVFEASFSQNEVLENDIVINEIMFDPTPRVNLPDAEYLELFNNSDHDILLDNWKLIVGKKEYQIPTSALSSGDYVLITKDVSLFEGIYCIEVPISSLSNNGTVIKLVNDLGFVVNQVSYSSSMFYDAAKNDGGWSLELINPRNNCLGGNNWNGSISEKGGTPGLENSILDFDYFPELKNEITQISASDDVLNVFVLFEGLLDESSISVESDYSGDYSFDYEGKPNGASLITLNLKSGLSEINYFLFKDLQSCDGTEVVTDTVWVSQFQPISKGDILINEVMFNPKEGSREFVEVFNNSDKFLSLRNVYLSNFTTDDDESIKDGEKRITDENVIFAPKSYFVLSKDYKSIASVYTSATRHNFIELYSLPKLNNDEGNVAILDPAFNFIDKMVYSSDMHVGLISEDKQKGISLERIKAANPSLDFNNWTSASQASGGATPGLFNSVSPKEFVGDDLFEVYPDVFTPNNDGVNDVVELKYNLNKVGVIANVKIFNSNGVFIKDIANNILLGSDGSFIWDGMNNYNSLCEKGIYIFWVEFFDENGNVSTYKEICVLG